MHMMPSSTPSQDLTAAWHAVAPPPPPSSSSRGGAGMSSKRSASALFMPGNGSRNSLPNSPSSSSLGFDRVARGDDLPADCHAPEPERPVSRNAMAREKQRQRARTNSYSNAGNAGLQQQEAPIPRARSPAPPVSPHDASDPRMATVRGHASFGSSAYNQPPIPHYHQSPTSPMAGPGHAYAGPHAAAMRGRYDSSPASAAPWSTYSPGQMTPQHQQQHHPQPQPQPQPSYSPPQGSISHPQQSYPQQQQQYNGYAPIAAPPPSSQWQQPQPFQQQQYFDQQSPAAPVQQPAPHAWTGNGYVQQAQPPPPSSPAPPAAYSAYHAPSPVSWQAQQGYAPPPSPGQMQMPPPTQPASYFQQPQAHAPPGVPFPSNAATAAAASHSMPPPVSYPTSTAPPATYNGIPAGSSRSSSIDSSLSGGSARTSSVSSMSGTVRRGLPQPPTQQIGSSRQAPLPAGPGIGAIPAAHAPSVAPTAHSHSHAASTSSNATLTRHDSVRMAAEEIMSRGPPRRRGMPKGFGPTASSSTGSSTASNSTSSSLSKALSQADSSATSISSQMEAISIKDQSKPQSQPQPQLPSQQQPESHQPVSWHQQSPHAVAPPSTYVAPPPSVPVRAASPRPIRAAPEPAPEVTVPDVDTKSVIPDRPKSRGPRDDLIAGRERRASVVEAASNAGATAQDVPQIFSPPPDTKPPVPTFSFGMEADDNRPKHSNNGPTVPSIVVPGDSSNDIPAISVGGGDESDDAHTPMISISGVDEEQGVKPSGSISISVSSSNLAQHSTVSSNRGQTPGPPLAKQSNEVPFARPAPASASSIGSGASCANCRKWIGGRVVHAMDTTWHPSCFVCWHCDEHLEHVAFYEHEGKPYCHFDYHELFSKRCFHCRTPIVDQRFITINDPELGGAGGEGGERSYHDLHFFCANCGDPFLDPKASGSAAGADPNLMNMVEDEDGKVRFGGREFVVHKGYPYCEKCHVNLHKPRCKGCKKPIAQGDVITALRAKWHPECFCCAFCNKPFESESFFIGKTDGLPYDEACYRIKLRSEI